MTCRELVNLLLDFVGGDLPPEVRARVEEHLCKCPPCVVYLETYEVTVRLTRQLPCPPLPDDVARRLKAALAEKGNEPEA